MPFGSPLPHGRGADCEPAHVSLWISQQGRGVERGGAAVVLWFLDPVLGNVLYPRRGGPGSTAVASDGAAAREGTLDGRIDRYRCEPDAGRRG